MPILLVNMSVDLVTGGGTATRTIQIAKSIQEYYGEKCMILSTDQGLDIAATEQSEDPNMVILPCLNDRFYIPYFSFSKMKNIVNEADIIHLMSHWTIINAIVYLFARYLKKPYTFCPAGTLHIFGRSSLLKRAYNFIIGESIIKNASQCIAITELEKNDFLEFNIPDENISVIPNGIDDSEFYPDYSYSTDFNNKFRLQNIPYILFMGRLNPIKGPDILLSAYVKLSSDFPEMHLVFAGPDEGLGCQLREEIKAKSLEDRVHIIGFVGGKDKVGAYTGAEFLVVPSRREAMSIVALEAGACGTPVILTTECGFDEVEEVGCIVVPPLEDELYRAMFDMLNQQNKIEKLGIELQSMILNRYTWKNTAEQYLKLI